VSPTPLRDNPGYYAALRAWFDEDWKCLDYLDWLRWPEGFVCPHCSSEAGWRARRTAAGRALAVSARVGDRPPDLSWHALRR
jgi:hypothetical protein